MAAHFADTWYFIAIIDPYDQHHEKAMRIERTLCDKRLLTHEYVLGEFLTYFSGEGALARANAVETVRSIRRSHEVVESTPALFELALNRYSSRLDKEYSFVDCMSMVLMEHRGITSVVTNDHHFRQEGFTVVNE
jgi:predicted nucleic acid-binding protein